jgi:serine phosphatase RsbU (regulator of sigma subunit)
MKQLFIVTLFVLIKLSLFANRCDSLAQASQEQTGKLQVDALNEYARCFMNADWEKMDSITKFSISLSHKLGYKSGLARAYQNTGLYQHYIIQNLDSAKYYYQKALSSYSQNGDSLGVAKSCSDMGGYHMSFHQNTDALLYFERGLSISKANNYNAGISSFAKNIAAILNNSNLQKEAIPYMHMARQYADQNNVHSIITLYENLANIYSTLDIDSSNYYYNKVEKLLVKTDWHEYSARVYGNHAGIFIPKKDKQELPLEFKRLVDSQYVYCKKYQPKDFIHSTSLILNLGILKYIEGDLDSSKICFSKIYNSNQITITDANAKKRSAYFLAVIEYKKGNYQKSYDYFLKLNHLKDSLNDLMNLKAFSNAQSKFQVKEYKQEAKLAAIQKNLTDAELQKELAVSAQKDEEAKRQNIQKIGISIVLGLSLIAGLIAFRAFRHKEKANKIITEQKEIVEEKNKEIMDSINYARRIQTAILPPNKIVKEYLPDSFILYKPKDIVAGDFYWMEKSGDKLLIAAADCTGHGVPGAIVSVICNNGLNRSVREHKLTDPGEILDQTRKIVISEFEKSEEEVKDGMDIALCSLENNILKYAGAHNPLWIIKKDSSEVTEIKANKQPIGKFEAARPFTTHSIELEEGDTFYIFSDGYADQFGGDRGKKFKTNKFKELLVSIQSESVDRQKEIIDESFENWKGDLEQLDDVCVMCVRV